MRKRVSGYFTGGPVVDRYYLVDSNNHYQNLIFICGEPWVTKRIDEREAVVYTSKQMVVAKEYFKTKRKLKVYESSVIKVKNKKR